MVRFHVIYFQGGYSGGDNMKKLIISICLNLQLKVLILFEIKKDPNQPSKHD